MGVFGNSLKRELGKNTGKFISNVIFGDKHSAPYRRVDSRRQVAMNARIAEAEARRRVEEDFREKMIINAKKNVLLQHVPYFDVQNTDERIETLSQMRG